MQDSYQPQELVDFPGGEAQFLGLVLRPLPLGYIHSLPPSLGPLPVVREPGRNTKICW